VTRKRSAATLAFEALRTAAHVWHVCPEKLSPATLEKRCLPWLSADERARRVKFSTARLRHDFLVTRALCRAVLSHYTAVDPADWRFVEGKHGKPAISLPRKFKSIRFNLTHTDGFVACIVSRAGEVGIDAEETSRHVNIEQVARHFLPSDEQSRLSRMPASRRARRFFEQWVLREAYLKGLGSGLTDHLDRISVQVPIGNWHLALHRPTQRHVAATAVRLRRGRKPIRIRWIHARGLIDARVAVVG
jgi:4'-phosphopantetheinyl transferase